jgi:hypothetical protein
MLDRRNEALSRYEGARTLPSARIFTTCDITHLMVIVHLRRHLQRPPTREFLIWHPLENVAPMDRVMSMIVPHAGFDDTLDMRGFASLKPRTQHAAAWWFEAPRRLRQDTATLRGWMTANGIAEESAELWAADPFHLNVTLPRAALRRSIHVKSPHCFNFEDAMTPYLKRRFESGWRHTSLAKRHIYYPWLCWSAGVDMRIDRIVYDRAYTFAAPSPWSANSIDVSKLISIEAFAATYGGLPMPLRSEVDAMLAPIRASAKPLVLLVLFGLGDSDRFRSVYQRTLTRIFTEHARELRDCTLAVKWHPGASGGQERLLGEWMRANLPARIHEIGHPLNLEFMLPQLKPDYVIGGLCGSLPIVRDLRAGRPIILAEWLDLYLAERPGEGGWVREFLRGTEIW